MKYLYYIEDEGLENAIEFDSFEIENSIFNAEGVVKEAAKDFWYNHDSWDMIWPIRFHLFTIDQKHIGDFRVEFVPAPEFEAYPLKKS